VRLRISLDICDLLTPSGEPFETVGRLRRTLDPDARERQAP
jgi:hypothetical protein